LQQPHMSQETRVSSQTMKIRVNFPSTRKQQQQNEWLDLEPCNYTSAEYFK
jgi:hypothetical protein